MFLALYINYDKKGIDYGINCYFCNIGLPFGLSLKNNSDYPQNFVLLDEDGFELVGTGFRYKKSTFKINEFLGYGYNATSVIVKCTDSLNNIKYLESYETPYKSTNGNHEISFKDLSKIDFEKIQTKYKWVEINEEKYNAILFMKFLFIVGALISMLFIARKIFRLRNKKSSNI